MKTWLDKETCRISALVERFEGYVRQAKGTQASCMKDIRRQEEIVTSYETQEEYRKMELETLRRIRNRLPEVKV